MNLELKMLILIFLSLPVASAHGQYEPGDPRTLMRLTYHDYIRIHEESGLRSQHNQCEKKTLCECKTTIRGFFYKCDQILYAESARGRSVRLSIHCNHTVSREDIREHVLDLSEVALDSPIYLELNDCPPDSISDFKYPGEIKYLSIGCRDRKDYILASDQFQNLSSLENLSLHCVSLRNLPENLFQTKLRLSSLRLENTMIERIGKGLLSNLPDLVDIFLVKNEKLSLEKNTFLGLQSLRLLDIVQSSFEEVEDDFFEPISNISRLFISQIGWKRLPTSFTLLHKLEHLEIVQTSIEWMGYESCNQRIGMNAVIITENPSFDIHPGCLDMYNNSGVITLSGNRISSLPNRTILFNRLWYFQFNDNRGDINSLENFIQSTTLQTFKMRNSSVRSIHKDFFRSTPSIRFVDLSENKLTHLPDSIFESNEDLTDVLLRGNKLTSVPETLLVLKPLLKMIDLSHNDILKIDLNVTQNFSFLEHLDLSHNKLTHILENPFSSMPNITFFDISNNDILQIDEVALQEMRNLKTLRIGGNKMEGKFFPHPQGFQFLTIFSAESNSFTEINWLNISSLQDLNLSNNLIEKLDLRVFDASVNLLNLNLSRNRIEALPRHIFSWHLKNLISLDLSFNRLKSLPDNIYIGIYRGNSVYVTVFYNLILDFLDLSGNPLERFDLSWLGDTKSFRKAVIRSSNISNLCSKRLEIVNVVVLDLSHNEISSKNWPWYYDGLLKSSGKLSPFVDLVSLEELYLAHNGITDIPIDFRNYNPKLRILDLRYNKIKHLTYQELLYSSYHFDNHGNAAPYGFCHSLTVDLRNNLIRGVDLPHAMLARNVTSKCEKHEYSHATILLGNNPFDCGCKVLPFLRVVEEDIVLTSEIWRSKGKSWLMQARINAENLTCRYPDSVKEKLVISTDTWVHHLLPMMGFCYLSEDKEVIDTK